MIQLKGGLPTLSVIHIDGSNAQLAAFANSGHNFKADIRKTRHAGCSEPSPAIAQSTTLR